MKFPDLLAAFRSPPKTLPQATETIAGAQATLDSVAALFTAAGLNLEQMLAAGPDALKAHLESVDNSEELAEALQENEKLSADLAAANCLRKSAEEVIEAHTDIFKVIGFAHDPEAKPELIKSLFEQHVSKQTTLALAKTGHPPAHVPAVVDAPAAKSDEDLAKEYETLPRGSKERQAFYAQHEPALWRAAQRASNKTAA